MQIFPPPASVVFPIGGANGRIKADGSIQVKNPTTGLYYTILGATAGDGSIQTNTSQTGES